MNFAVSQNIDGANFHIFTFQINSFVKEATNGIIDKIFDESAIDPLSRKESQKLFNNSLTEPAVVAKWVRACVKFKWTFTRSPSSNPTRDYDILIKIKKHDS